MYLNCHSYYSLRYGTFSEENLLSLAKASSVKHLALTDINSTSASLNFLRLCSYEKTIHPIVGVDIRNGIEQLYVLLAKNNNGYQEINIFLSKHLEEKTEFPQTANFSNDVGIIYPFEHLLKLEKEIFSDNEYIGISTLDINKAKFSKLKLYKDRLVIQQPVTFRCQSGFNAHRLLRAIDLNILLSKLPKEEQGNIDHKMLPVNNLKEMYYDFENIIENTLTLAESCKVTFLFEEERENQNQATFLESTEKDYNYLRKLCFDNLANRYPQSNQVVLDRIEKELSAINTMNFVSYFLINYDIIQYAKSKDYPHIGRGSGANSIVAYIIGITNVDPIELDLYFERFINVFRSSPPDFDIDFSWKDRDDITAYIFNKYPNTALMGTYVTFQYRAVIRELGKVFGLPKYEIDDYLIGKKSQRSSTSDSFIKLIEKYGKLIHGFPNYTSVHSGGILILDKSVHYYSATILPPKNFRTVQFDMNIAEEVGIYKFDILAQRGLSKIKDTIEIIQYNQPDIVLPDMEDTLQFKEDPQINDLLKVGNCIGVFYVESPAMRTLMTKLQTQTYLGLVAASSIIRPGVTNGGMKNEYILRHRDPKRRKEAHPILLKVLHETYGVMVYQEDVLKVAHKFADLDLSEADILRRGMRGKVKSKGQFEQIEKKFKSNCIAKGYSEKDTLEVWDQVRAFAGYAFAKGHSASYAVESYQSLYLKKYFPLEFMTAVLNNGGGFYNIETYIHEITMCGGRIHAPCINLSDHINNIYDTDVYLGLGMIQHIELRNVEKILTERNLNGRFTSFENFIDRIKMSAEQLIIFIRCNCFRFTGLDKHKLLWKAHFTVSKQTKKHSEPKLFQAPQIDFIIPDFKTNSLIDAYDELELLGFPLCSYFRLLASTPENNISRKDFPNYNARQLTIYGKLVTAKGTPTSDKRLMHFGTFLDVNGEVFDTVHFPKISEKFSIKANGIYKIIGRVVEELGYYSLIVDEIYHQPILQDPRYEEKHQEGKKRIV